LCKQLISTDSCLNTIDILGLFKVYWGEGKGYKSVISPCCFYSLNSPLLFPLTSLNSMEEVKWIRWYENSTPPGVEKRRGGLVYTRTYTRRVRISVDKQTPTPGGVEKRRGGLVCTQTYTLRVRIFVDKQTLTPGGVERRRGSWFVLCTFYEGHETSANLRDRLYSGSFSCDKFNVESF